MPALHYALRIMASPALALTLVLAGPRLAAGVPDFVHYRANSPQKHETLSNGVELARWAAPLGEHHGLGTDLTLRPPSITKLTLHSGQQFPLEGEPFWLDEDVVYMVIQGAVSCKHCQGREKVLGEGDMFVSDAKRPHGPLVGTGFSVLMVATASHFAYHTSPAPAPRYLWATGQRLLKNPTWGPSFLGRLQGESATCMRAGGVKIHEWPQQGRLPNVMAVSLHSDCMIPCHQHINGALYFVIDGEFVVFGDGGAFNTTFRKGDLRWARSGFVYGPEYASMAGSARLNVLGLPGALHGCHDHPPH